MRQLMGYPASSGYALGSAYHLKGTAERTASVEDVYISSFNIAEELQRFNLAVNNSLHDLTHIRERLVAQQRKQEAEIIDVQLLLLEDPEFIGSAREKVAAGYSALSAIQAIEAETIDAILSLDDPYLRERTLDIEDLASRIIGQLRGKRGLWENISTDSKVILICEELKPSEAVQLDASVVAGIATARGGQTSHFAIIARSFGIPVVIGVGDHLASIADKQLVLLDGHSGLLIVDPSDSLMSQYELSKQRQRKKSLPELAPKPNILGTDMTTCNLSTPSLLSNIQSPEDAELAKSLGAEGIGLYRSEFLFMGRRSLPSEDEQYDVYCKIAALFDTAMPATIRTIDVGGDKSLLCANMPEEDNPALGMRGIRFSLHYKKLLREQLRALLRASAQGKIRLLLPMLSTLGELREFHSLLVEVRQELDCCGLAYDRYLQVGVMIEIPSAALMAHKMAQEADFLSIGSNDLTQFTMATDRSSPHLQMLNDPLQPAVLQLIKHITQAAHSNGKRVSLCGEMSTEPLALPLLLGFGLNELSVGSNAIQDVRWVIRHITDSCRQSELVELADKAVSMDSAEEVRSMISNRFPELVQLQLDMRNR